MSNSSRRVSRGVWFALVCVMFALVSAAYIAHIRATGPSTPTTASPSRAAVNLAVLGGRAGLLFASAAFDATNRALTLAPRIAADAERHTGALECERVHFAGGMGICLTADRGLVTAYAARVFDARFRVRHTLPLAGAPSRARVSPDGRRAVSTVFVAGDSYNATGFSTRTTIIDTERGNVIADLEEFEVWRDGERIKAVDFNFWGVTFARDSNRFYATLRTGGTNHLVEGDVDRRTVRVLREGVECPSLSPDNTRVAFKSRVSGSTWRVHLLDLETMRDVPLAETRNFDDQAEWLDDETIAYSLPSQAAAGGSDVWALKVTAGAAPQILVRNAYSPVAIR